MSRTLDDLAAEALELPKESRASHMRISIALILSTFIATIAIAQRPPATEVLLVPTFGAPQAGEFESIWVSTFTARNTGSTPVCGKRSIQSAS